MADPYSVLGVAKTANQKEIKSAFRKLAKQYHPDHNPDNKDAQQKFAEINQAYEILGDSEKKAKYDRGEIDGEGKPNFNPFNSGGNFSGSSGSWSNPFANMRSGGFSSAYDSDIFREFFGGAMGGRSYSPFGGKAGVNKNIAADIEVNLEDIIANKKVEVKLPDGRNLKVQLPKFVEDRQVLRLKGQGQRKYPGSPGDVLITIKVKKHPCFKVEGADLYLEQKIALQDAIKGGKIIIDSLDGKTSLNLPSWIDSGKIFRFKAKGLPRKNGSRGDLYVKLLITLPQQHQKEITDFFANLNFN